MGWIVEVHAEMRSATRAGPRRPSTRPCLPAASPSLPRGGAGSRKDLGRSPFAGSALGLRPVLSAPRSPCGPVRRERTLQPAAGSTGVAVHPRGWFRWADLLLCGGRCASCPSSTANQPAPRCVCASFCFRYFIMGRMHAPGHGISRSAQPYVRSAPGVSLCAPALCCFFLRFGASGFRGGSRFWSGAAGAPGPWGRLSCSPCSCGAAELNARRRLSTRMHGVRRRAVC